MILKIYQQTIKKHGKLSNRQRVKFELVPCSPEIFFLVSSGSQLLATPTRHLYREVEAAGEQTEIIEEIITTNLNQGSYSEFV